MPWPPAIEMSTENQPEELERLLKLIFSGGESNTPSVKIFVARISKTMETQQACCYLCHLEISL